MAEKQTITDGGVGTEPETEEEWLTDSETGEAEALHPVSQLGSGIALVSSVPIKPDTKPKLWLFSLDWKMSANRSNVEILPFYP